MVDKPRVLSLFLNSINKFKAYQQILNILTLHISVYMQIISIKYCLNRGSYMSAHVVLNLLNELGKRDKMRGLPSI